MKFKYKNKTYKLKSSITDAIKTVTITTVTCLLALGILCLGVILDSKHNDNSIPNKYIHERTEKK